MSDLRWGANPGWGLSFVVGCCGAPFIPSCVQGVQHVLSVRAEQGIEAWTDRASALRYLGAKGIERNEPTSLFLSKSPEGAVLETEFGSGTAITDCW